MYSRCIKEMLLHKSLNNLLVPAINHTVMSFTTHVIAGNIRCGLVCRFKSFGVCIRWQITEDLGYEFGKTYQIIVSDAVGVIHISFWVLYPNSLSCFWRENVWRHWKAIATTSSVVTSTHSRTLLFLDL